MQQQLKKGDRVRHKFYTDKGHGTVRAVFDNNTADVLWDKHRIGDSPVNGIINKVEASESLWWISDLAILPSEDQDNVSRT